MLPEVYSDVVCPTIVSSFCTVEAEEISDYKFSHDSTKTSHLLCNFCTTAHGSSSLTVLYACWWYRSEDEGTESLRIFSEISDRDDLHWRPS